LKLVSPYNFSFSEALTQYVITKKNGKKTLEGHQEITRFVAWVGRERTISELTPSEVADYAQHIGLGGSESAQRLSPVKGFLTFLKEQGWVETSLAPHLRIPRSRRTSTSKRSTGADSTSNGAQFSGAQLSQEGYDRLQAQLASLKEERVKVVEDIKRAMEDKDFRENSPLDAAKERQGRKRVAIGVKVTLKELDTGKLIRYTLVDVREANVSAGKISTASPVGQALLDRKVGDKVSVNVPKGTLLYSIEEIGA
jgi:transcription elongation factor GreA